VDDYLICNSTLSTSGNAILCKCTITRRETKKKQRRLGVVEKSGAITIVATAKYAASDFQNTFEATSSFNSLEAVQDSLIVLMMFIVLWSFGLLLLFVYWVRMRLMKNENRKMNDAINRHKQAARVSRSPAAVSNPIHRDIISYCI